ncbi:CBS domain-containing protein [Paraconexibacter antarcticus]|uniref:CBS domain-containing protein n=1 Tax=Paraconexibacter antarcticus TaxID=2949664 RepID=A0ABY5DWA3_9ACTN|nr:CBS domain-containing protein [Paraconexibacter antarcticus]UTI64962.1 CBS domain-containing protein [Paraconexibacter antarcticus]
MADIAIDEAAGLTAADLVHVKLTATDASATVADVQAFFAASTSRRLAVLAEDGRFAGVLTREDAEGAPDPAAPARSIAHDGPTVAAGASAEEARTAVMDAPSRRVPVVAEDGTLVGVVALDETRTHFCGTAR